MSNDQLRREAEARIQEFGDTPDGNFAKDCLELIDELDKTNARATVAHVAELETRLAKIGALAEKARSLTAIGHGVWLDVPANRGSVNWADQAFFFIQEFLDTIPKDTT